MFFFFPVKLPGNRSPQSRKPVWRHTALRTWRRSLPLRVLPAPSSTENASIGDCALATISCGGNISPSPPSSSSLITSSNSWYVRIAAARDMSGTFTGADWYLTEEGSGIRSSGGFGINGIMREEEEDDEEEDEADVFW